MVIMHILYHLVYVTLFYHLVYVTLLRSFTGKCEVVSLKSEHHAFIKWMVQDISYKENPTVEDFFEINWGKYAQVREYICSFFNSLTGQLEAIEC